MPKQTKADLLDAIKAANGTELAEADYTAKELELLLELAGDPAKKTEFDAQLAALKGRTSPPLPDKPKTASVMVAPAIAAYGGEFTDPESGVTIGQAPVEAPLTAFVREKLRADELVEG